VPLGALVIVAQPEDPVAVRVRHVVAARGVAIVWYAPDELATLNVELTEETFNVDDTAVRTVLWRVSPEMALAESFREHDRTFAGAETAAMWIAALRMHGTAAVNRFDAEAWYSGLRSQYWRDRLRAAGIAVTSICVGDQPLPSDWQWSPYTTGEPCELSGLMARAVMASACHGVTRLVTSVSVCGEIVTDCPDANVRRAAELLDAWGIGLVAIDSDRDGRVHRLRVLPVFDDASLLERVTTILGDRLYEHCAARRS